MMSSRSGIQTSLMLALLALVFMSAGCTTTRKSLFSTTGPGWTVRQGQALWRPGRSYPELAGELVFATDQGGRCAIEFAKTPISLVSAQSSENEWFIHFQSRPTAFAGHGNPPTRFAWLYLPLALAGKPLPKVLRFQREADGAWLLENTRTGETLRGFFVP